MIPKEILVILVTFSVGLYLYVPVLAAITCKDGAVTITNDSVTAPTTTKTCDSGVSGCMTQDSGNI